MAGETLTRRDTPIKVSSSLISARTRRLVGRFILYVVVLGASLIFMLPFIYTVLSSLKTPSELFMYPPKWIPATPRPQNYLDVFDRVAFGSWLWNSLYVALVGTAGGVLSAALVGYSFARFRYPGRNILFMITLSTMMLPVEVTLIPLYLMFSKIGWLDTYQPLIVPSFFGGGAFLIFLMRQFFMTIPKDLDEAARIDGAGYLRIFWQILLPLSVPALATASILTFMGRWDAFLEPFIFINSTSKFTVAIGIRYFQAVQSTADAAEHNEHLLMAASVMMTAPIILLFFAAQRYFVRGIVMTGIKG